MSYNVYLVSSFGAPRDHHAIFVETESDQSGSIFQVYGDIQGGMEYESKQEKKPEESVSFLGKEFIGQVTIGNFPRINSICSGIVPPARQFNGARRIDPNIPLRRCQEWTGEAIKALKNNGILQ